MIIFVFGICILTSFLLFFPRKTPYETASRLTAWIIFIMWLGSIVEIILWISTLHI